MVKPANAEVPDTSLAPRRQWTRAFSGPLGAGALAALFFLALLWRDPMLCWNDDYAISILPVLADVARSWGEGHWPLLSPYCWACGNLAGEYQYGTFSIFVNAVVVLVWKCHLSYPNTAAALSAAHVFVMAAGGFQLARGRGLNSSLALMVGLVASLNGWMVCWGATNWFGALAALAWLPWAWWALEESLRANAPWRRWLLPAPFIYLLLAGGFPYTVVMLILVTAWLAARCWLTERRWLAPLPLAVGWLLGLGLAAPAWLSLLEYMHGSGRARGDDLYHDAWVVPWRALPGLITPSWGAWWPDFGGKPWARPALEFIGSLVPLAALGATLAARWRGTRVSRLPAGFRWDAAFAALTLVLCMLPSAGVFRWSFRWLPLFHLALALAGAEALRLWREAKNDALVAFVKWWEHPATWATGLSGLAVLLTPLIGARYEGVVRQPALVPLALFGVSLAWWLGVSRLPRASNLRRWLPAAATLGTLVVSYALLPTNPRVPRYPFTGNLADPAPLSRERLYLAYTDSPFIKYHGPAMPSGFGAVLRPGSTAMFGEIHLVNGYTPIRAAGVAQRFKLETHGQIDYPHLGEFLRPEITGPDGLLARMGVDGLIVAGDLPFHDGPGMPTEWEEVFRSNEGAVYHRRGGVRPEVSAWKLREPGGPEEFGAAQIEVREDSRQRVEARVAVAAADVGKPVLVAFRRPYFPGYHATFNGKAVPVGSYQGLLPTVELPAGVATGDLVLYYRPGAVVLGGGVVLLTIIVVLVIVYATKRRRRSGEKPASPYS